VVTVVGSAVVTAAVGSPEDMVVGSPVGMVAGLAAAASVAVGLGVVASGVARLAVSGVGSVVSAEPRSVAGSAELDLTAYAGEASASQAFAATEAFRSRQVWVLEAGATMTPALFGPATIGSTSATDRATRRGGTRETLTWLFR
jgi:hypothetical protein